MPFCSRGAYLCVSTLYVRRLNLIISTNLLFRLVVEAKGCLEFLGIFMHPELHVPTDDIAIVVAMQTGSSQTCAKTILEASIF
jgi:hypothetical protein